MQYQTVPARPALTKNFLADSLIFLLISFLVAPAIHGQTFHTLFNFPKAYGRPDNLLMAPNGTLIGSARGPDAYYLHPHNIVFAYSPQHTMSMVTQFWAPLGRGFSYAEPQPGGDVLSSDTSLIYGYTEAAVSRIKTAQPMPGAERCFQFPSVEAPILTCTNSRVAMELILWANWCSTPPVIFTA